VQKQLIDHALRDFRLAGVGLDPARKERFKNVMLELTSSRQILKRMSDATNGWSYHVCDESQLRGLNSTLIEQARKPARAACEGWILTLTARRTLAVVTDAESEP